MGLVLGAFLWGVRLVARLAVAVAVAVAVSKGAPLALWCCGAVWLCVVLACRVGCCVAVA